MKKIYLLIFTVLTCFGCKKEKQPELLFAPHTYMEFKGWVKGIGIAEWRYVLETDRGANFIKINNKFMHVSI